VIIEVEIGESDAHNVIVNELIYERSLLKKPKYRCENKKEYLAAIETVLDYFDANWRETSKK
jgi:hypothetical protein